MAVQRKHSPGSAMLFRLPDSIDLTTTPPPSPRTSITNLPLEILLPILSDLSPTDQLCLALTCKPLAHILTTVPSLPKPSTPIIGTLFSSPNTPRPLSITLTPDPAGDRHTLLPRLALGWLPTQKYKYCWKCNKNFPRDRTFHQRTLSQKVPAWHQKLKVTQAEWADLSREQRQEYMIERFLKDDNDNNEKDTIHASLPPRIHTVTSHISHHNHGHLSINQVTFSSTPGVYNYYPNPASFPDLRGPECPSCLERELTFVYIDQWKPAWYKRAFLGEFARYLLDVSVGRALLVLAPPYRGQNLEEEERGPQPEEQPCTQSSN